MREVNAPTTRLWRALTLGAIVVGVILRFSYVAWSDPWSPHHPDEHTLPVEALALWEGVAPYDLGWPASTTRVAMSGVLAVQWAIEQGQQALQNRDGVGGMLGGIAHWIGERFVDPSALYRMGRGFSAVTGLLHLLATVWALSRWTKPAGVALGTLAVAISPMAVTHSQYVLADVTGLLFATLAVGFAANPDARSARTMSILAALAAMSKFHFGVWVLLPLACIWLNEPTWQSRVRLTVVSVAIVACTTLILLPWVWTNPLYVVKEFMHVVGLKVTGGARDGVWRYNIPLVFGGLGTLLWLGALLGLPALAGTLRRRLAAIAIPVALGTLALATSAVVFDRHGLVLLPGLVVVLAVGVDWWAEHLQLRGRVVAAGVLAVSVVLTGNTLAYTMRLAGEAGLDALTRDWVLSHVPRGRRVAIYNEANAFLPRTPEQLLACARYTETDEGFAEKWRLLEFGAQPGAAEPFRTALLNDELFRAYRCRRELMASRDPGYTLVPYHTEPRFDSVLEPEAIREFNDGAVDVLIVNRQLTLSVAPAAVLKTARGMRVVYVRQAATE